MDCGRMTEWSCGGAGCCWAKVDPNPKNVPLALDEDKRDEAASFCCMIFCHF